MRALRVLQISTRDLGGGAEGSARDLFHAYRNRGHKSWLAVGQKYSDDPDVFEIPRLKPGVPWARLCWSLHGRLAPLEDKLASVSSLRCWLRILAGGWSELDRHFGREDFNYPGTRRLLRLVPEWPDIVHAHNLHGDYFDLRFLAKLSHQIPIILNLRDMWLLTGHCAHPLGCEKWKTGCGSCPDLSIYPAVRRDATAFNWRRKRRIYRRGRFYVSVISRWQLEQVQSSILQGIQTVLIPNAINLSVFKRCSQAEARQRLGLPTDVKIVMLTAHNQFKDYATMESAIRGLKRTNGSGFLFVCLGKPGESHTLGDGLITYPGFERDPNRMALYYCASDVFIQAAKAEAFGKTIAEAMACGTPVVATSTGGIPELVDEGVTGYLVPPNESLAMKDRVQQLLDDDSLRRWMGQRASVVARQRFDLARQVDDFLNWYQEILHCEGSGYAVSKSK